MSAKTVLATSRPYIRLVCQEAICCTCRMEHFMEVQELIFAVHPGMTDHLSRLTYKKLIECWYSTMCRHNMVFLLCWYSHMYIVTLLVYWCMHSIVPLISWCSHLYMHSIIPLVSWYRSMHTLNKMLTICWYSHNMHIHNRQILGPPHIGSLTFRMTMYNIHNVAPGQPNLK